jgi:hypothetical protein
MVSLRALAIASNVAFLSYGLAAQLWPIVMLHAIMLPLNVIRLHDALASRGPPSCVGGVVETEDQLTLTERRAPLSLRMPRWRNSFGR